jgi:hypothetical protein
MRLATALGVCAFMALAGPAAAQLQDGQRAICPLLYKPVCAERDGDTRTFPNGCRAQAAGYAIVSQGTCDGAGKPMAPG